MLTANQFGVLLMSSQIKTWQEPARALPVIGSYDVIVAGGGTAGVCAAIAAARKGCSTLLIEQFGSLGGTQTAGLVDPLCPNFHEDGTPLTRGIGQEIWNRLGKSGFGYDLPDTGKYAPGVWAWFDFEQLKQLEEEMVIESGAKILFHTCISAPMMDGDKVCGLIIENKSGRQAIEAKIVIDCTGDADVVFRSGAPCENGRPSDGLNQPSSLRFHVGNVDWKKLSDFLKQHNVPLLSGDLPTVSYGVGGGAKDLAEYLNRCAAEGKVALEDIRYFQFFAAKGRPGEISFNCPEIRSYQGTNGNDISAMQLEGRRAINRLIDFCKRCLPGFENCYLVCVAAMPGVRSSRRVVTEQVLTVEEVIQGKKFEDAVARNNWPPDIHSVKEDEELYLDHEPVDFVEIPYGALVPKNIDNLLVAGRCIGVDFGAQAAIRIARTCQALGEAAGVAAAMAIQAGVPPRKLSGSDVHKALAKDGLL